MWEHSEMGYRHHAKWNIVTNQSFPNQIFFCSRNDVFSVLLFSLLFFYAAIYDCENTGFAYIIKSHFILLYRLHF